MKSLDFDIQILCTYKKPAKGIKGHQTNIGKCLKYAEVQQKNVRRDRVLAYKTEVGGFLWLLVFDCVVLQCLVKSLQVRAAPGICIHTRHVLCHLCLSYTYADVFLIILDSLRTICLMSCAENVKPTNERQVACRTCV